MAAGLASAALTLVAVVIAYLVLRRTGSGRRGGALPGV
jgi:hypothetical protein